MKSNPVKYCTDDKLARAIQEHLDGQRCTVCQQLLGALLISLSKATHYDCEPPAEEEERKRTAALLAKSAAKDPEFIRRRDEIAESMAKNSYWGETPWWMKEA